MQIFNDGLRQTLRLSFQEYEDRSSGETVAMLQKVRNDIKREISGVIRELSSRKEQIVILIAHRLSTIAHADTIYVLERGRIVESGVHDELVEKEGLYYAMWRQQIGERTLRQFQNPVEREIIDEPEIQPSIH